MKVNLEQDINYDYERRMSEIHQAVMPYLIFRDATDFITFTKKIFGATVGMKEMRNKITIRYAENSIGSTTIIVLFFTSEFSPHIAGLFVYVNDSDQRFKQAICLGAEIVLEISEQSYDRSG